MASRRVFFLGAMGWGDGISRMVVVVVVVVGAPRMGEGYPLELGFGEVFDINSSRWGLRIGYMG